MKVIAYLAFTMLSIAIQFCVMDLTQEKLNLEDDKIEFSSTGRKERFDQLIKTLTDKPLALYYRTPVNNKLKSSNVTPPLKSHESLAIQGMETTTVIPSTVIDELYDENSSTTEDTFTTESFYSTTEFENVTEITFFEKKNRTTDKTTLPKKSANKECSCNLLYDVCDINCCCDSDCTASEQKLFVDCKNIPKRSEGGSHLCYPPQYFSRGGQDNIIDNLFCIVKTNLPQKRNLNTKKYDAEAISHSYKWTVMKQTEHTQFEKKPYVYGDPVWVLKEGSIWYIDTPSPTVNNYCSGRKPILFLNNANVKCIVDMNDLEMYQILKTSKEAPCISVTDKSMNSSALNCSTLHCTNWSTIVCNDFRCVDYNESTHKPFCTKTSCSNVALKIEYIFHYYDSKIMNATIKLYTQNVSAHFPYMNQEISVKFVLTNQSIDNITEISGNPGYLYGRPLIASVAETNRSVQYFNTTSKSKKYMSHLRNKRGFCAFSVTEPAYILFGENIRINCRFVYNKKINTDNSSNACKDLEKNIEQLFGLTEKTFVSPYGNPLDVKDNAWVSVAVNFNDKDITYGQYVKKTSKLRCFNMVTRISYVFAYADVSEKSSKIENKIVFANVSLTTQNVTFTISNADDISVVLTTDINFIDGTKPRLYEYAAGPYISVRLPEDFFFPFRSNGERVSYNRSVNLMLILLNLAMYRQIK